MSKKPSISNRWCPKPKEWHEQRFPCYNINSTCCLLWPGLGCLWYLAQDDCRVDTLFSPAKDDPRFRSMTDLPRLSMLWYFDSLDTLHLSRRNLVLVLSDSQSCHQCMLCRCKSNSSQTCSLTDDFMSIWLFYRDLRLFLKQPQHSTCEWQAWAGEAAFYHSHAIMHSATQCTFSESRKSLPEPAAVLHNTSAQLVFQESNSNLKIWLRNLRGLLKP